MTPLKIDPEMTQKAEAAARAVGVELPEFARPTLEALRQPLEAGRVSIARANSHVTYPARVQLVAAMNPCRCGHLDDPALACFGEDRVRVTPARVV